MPFDIHQFQKSKQEFLAGFLLHFKTNGMPFIDVFASKMSGECKLNIIKFDDYIQKKHGDYEPLSLSAYIGLTYGVEAEDFVRKFI